MEVTVVWQREWTEGHRTGHLKMVNVVTLMLTAFHHNEREIDSLGERHDVDKKLPRGGRNSRTRDRGQQAGTRRGPRKSRGPSAGVGMTPRARPLKPGVALALWAGGRAGSGSGVVMLLAWERLQRPEPSRGSGCWGAPDVCGGSASPCAPPSGLCDPRQWGVPEGDTSFGRD